LLTSGALPSGLVLDPASGAITGAPSVAGTSMLTFRVTDGLGVSKQKTFWLTINP
jgi:Putative Ig domain